ncbi:nucleoside-triphosphatase [Lachnotalea glycerini]|uniref:Nucleotide kinase n=1 Tax=Lachnotalea glycerini TaxID=1763509 RepID=A0A371JGI3_9FIRM|nr:nucleoside-triphosphatase [Lachnotalea glycerini]RDY31838.1 nucleotide kinase [Lachnotalea glycerini]
MHIFLTGEIKTGKTTLINYVCNEVISKGYKVGGFYSYFDDHREEENRCLYLNGAHLFQNYDEKQVVVRFTSALQPQVYTQRFNDFGKLYIRERKKIAHLLILDECSFFERQAFDFQHEILTALNEPIPILGVVRLGKASWTEQIANHNKVRLIEVTKENRNALRLELVDYFTAQIQRFPK